nr:hypothetical protein [Tanacetum cinerariifolium]
MGESTRGYDAIDTKWKNTLLPKIGQFCVSHYRGLGPIRGCDRLVSRAKVIKNQVPVVPADLPVAPVVGAATVASPVGVLELDIHSSSKSSPSEGSSSLTTSTLEIPILPTPPTIGELSTDIISPIVAPLGVRQRRAVLVQPGQDLPFGRLYRTYPCGPCRALTARKMVGPFPSYHLALRYTSHHLDRFTSGSSSDHSSFDDSSSDHSLVDHSSYGHSTSDQTLYIHTSPVTTIADSSTPSRFVYAPPTRTSWGSEAFRHWRSTPLSTMSLAATVPLPIPAPRALVPTRADLLPPRKRFRDSCLSEDIDADVLADIKACAEVDAGIEAIEELIAQRVAEALAAYEANRAAGLVVKSQNQNGDDGDNRNGRGNGDENGGRNGNGNGGGNRNGKPNGNDRVSMPITCECTYHEFIKCQPLNFKGIEGVVGLTR